MIVRGEGPAKLCGWAGALANNLIIGAPAAAILVARRSP